MITLGIISDTHIPDRARRLHPQIIPYFREAGVSAILHAGDVSTPALLEKLGRVAPVYAVRGNRDWVLLPHLPLARELEYGGVTVALTHGHGRWWNYFIDKVYVLVEGYQLERFQSRLQTSFPNARVIIFGHTHRPLNLWSNGQLIFNPGSPHFPDEKNQAPSIGLIQIDAGGQVKGEIVELS